MTAADLTGFTVTFNDVTVAPDTLYPLSTFVSVVPNNVSLDFGDQFISAVWAYSILGFDQTGYQLFSTDSNNEIFRDYTDSVYIASAFPNDEYSINNFTIQFSLSYLEAAAANSESTSQLIGASSGSSSAGTVSVYTIYYDPYYPAPTSPGETYVYSLSVSPPPGGNVTYELPLLPQVSVSGQQAGNNAAFTISLSGSIIVPVTVNYTATSPNGVLASGQISFTEGGPSSVDLTVPAGASAVSVSVPPNPVDEGQAANFTISASGSPSTDVEMDLTSAAGATIVNGSAVVTVPTPSVTVEYSSINGSGSVTLAPGTSTVVSVPVPIVDTTTALIFAPLTGVFVGQSADFVVSLTQPTSRQIQLQSSAGVATAPVLNLPDTIYYSIISGSAIASVDYSPITGSIPSVPGSTTATNINMLVLFDPNRSKEETAQLALTDSTGAQIGSATATIEPDVLFTPGVDDVDFNTLSTAQMQLISADPQILYTDFGGNGDQTTLPSGQQMGVLGWNSTFNTGSLAGQTYTIIGSDGSYSIALGAGNDTVEINGNGNSSITAGTGIGTISITGDGGNIVIGDLTGSVSISGGGSLELTGTFTGSATIGDGSTLQLDEPSNGGSITFEAGGSNEKLIIDGTTMPINVISGVFSLGDIIDLADITFDSFGASLFEADNVLQIRENGQVYDIRFDPTQSYVGTEFELSSDGGDGTNIISSPGPAAGGAVVSSNEPVIGYSSALYPYNGVVYIQANFPGPVPTEAGSGFIVGPHSILTASHVLWDSAGQKATSVSISGDITVGLINVVDGQNGQFETANEGAPLQYPTASDVQNDYAIINVAETLPFYDAIPLGTYSSGSLNITGYPEIGSYPADTQFSEIIGAATAGNGILAFDPEANVVHGFSGGPVWTYDGSSVKAVGIVSTSQLLLPDGLLSDYGTAVQLTPSDQQKIQNWEDSFSTVQSGETSSNGLVESGDILAINVGGSAIGTTVDAGGIESVSGLARETEINSGGLESVNSGGTDVAATISGGGQLMVYAGANASNDLVLSGAFLQLGLLSQGGVVGTAGGTASDTIISSGGFELVHSGGADFGATISSGGNLQVFAGASETGDVVLSGGLLLAGVPGYGAGGIAFDTTIGSGGSESVYSGGITSDSVVYLSGSLYVLSGGASVNATLSGGFEQLGFAAFGSNSAVPGGTASGTFVSSGGVENVDSAGFADGTRVGSAGFEIVNSGGVDTAATVNGGGQLLVYASGNASNDLVLSGALLLLGLLSQGDFAGSAGGSASGEIINSGGLEIVNSGGADSGATVNGGGNLQVFAGASETNDVVLSGGLLLVGVPGYGAGGIASDTTISSGGLEIVNSGGTDIGALVEDGGKLLVSAFGSTTSDSLVGSDSSGGGGLEVIFSGGTAVSTTLSASANLVVSAGGVALHAIVDSRTGSFNGGMNVSSGGVASATVINSGGYEFVDLGGIESGATVNQGGTLVNRGGTTIAVEVEQGGVLSVSSGGVDSSANITEGGLVVVSSGGITISALLTGNGPSNRAFETLSGGTASATTIVDAGALSVRLGGLAVGTIVNSSNFNTPGSNGGLFVSSGGLATGTIVNSGGLEVVFFGGTDGGVTINQGGLDVISSGGSEMNAIVSSGGALRVLAGGVADPTTIYSGGLEVISSGGTDSGAQILGGEQDVYGSAVATIVGSGGTEIVFLGGVGVNATVEGGGKLTVLAGGVDNDATVYGGVESGTNYAVISSAGVETVFGVASATTVTSGGKLFIEAGGSAVSAVLGSSLLFSNGEYADSEIIVESGGAVYDTFVSGTGFNSAAVNSLGLPDGTTPNGGLIVSAGGVASGTIIEGAGGTDQGLDAVYGGMDFNATVNSGGLLNIHSAGSAFGAAVNLGGVLNVFSGGADFGAEVANGGTLRVRIGGTDSGSTVLTGGSLVVSSGGTATEAVINGGSEHVLSGGHAVDVTFAGTSGAILLDDPSVLSGAISNWGIGDTVDFVSASIVSAGVSGSNLIVTEANTQTFSYQLVSQAQGTTAKLVSDQNGGTDLILVSAASPAVTVAIDNHDVNIARNTGTVTFSFTKAPIDFSLGDVTSLDGILSNLSGSGTSYTATFIANSGIDDSQAVISVIGGSYHDSNSTAGSGATSTAFVVDTVSPTVSSVSSAPASGDLNAGAVIDIIVGFDKNVTVTGIPALTLNDGGTALYKSGSGTNTLTFAHTVANAQNASVLAVTGSNLDGTSLAIADVDGNASDLSGADVSFAGLAIGATVRAIVATPPAGDLGSGNTVTFTVTMSEAVKITGGTPFLVLNDGGQATYKSGSGTNGLTFAYKVGALNSGQNTPALAVTGFNPNGATIYDSNVVADTADLSGVTGFTSGPQIDTIAPTIISVAANPADGDLNAGNTVTLAVAFSEKVTVDTTNGIPFLRLNDGGTANYADGSGTGVLTFTYLVASGQNTADLAVTGLTLNGGTIRDGAGNAAVIGGAASSLTGTLQIDTKPPAVTERLLSDAGVSNTDGITNSGTLTGGGDPNAVVQFTVDGTPVAATATASSTGAWTFSPTGLPDGQHTVVASETDAAGNTATASLSFTLDMTAPRAIGVTASSANNDLNVGNTVAVAVTFDNSVFVTGTPYLTLNDGGRATYVSGAGTDTLTFNYVVSASQNTAALAVTGASAGMRDVAGNAPDLSAAIATLPGPLQIDTKAPAVTERLVSDTGTSNTDKITDNDMLTGAGDPNAVVLFTIDGTQIAATATANSTGTWTFAPVGLSDGSHAIIASETDAAGNTGTASLTFTLDTAVPSATSITASPNNGDLDAGKTIAMTVVFGSPVFVTGTPYLALNDGGRATYASGAGTTALTFNYVVQAGQNTTALAVTGGSTGMRDVAGNVPDLSAVIGTLPGLQIDTAAPKITSVATSGTGITAGNGDLGPGSQVTLTVNFSEVVDVDTTNGTPTLGLSDGGIAAYTAGSGSNALAFTYVVGALGNGENSSDLKLAASNAVTLNGASIVDGAGNAAVLTAANGSNPAGTLQIDTTAPTVSKVVTSPASGEITTGHAIRITLDMSEKVGVAGSPVLLLNDGGTAAYDAVHSTPTALAFNYTVASGHVTTDLLASGIALDSSTSITDLAGNAANLLGAGADLGLRVNTLQTGPAGASGGNFTISGGQELELFGPSTANVTFAAGSTGILEVLKSQSFAGTVAGLALGNSIDLADLAFSGNATPSYAGGASGGTLSVTEGSTINLSLLGNYLASSFVASSDGHGGTLVSDPPADQHNVIAPPHSS